MLTIIVVNFGVIELGWEVMTTMYLGVLEGLSADGMNSEGQGTRCLGS